MLTIILVSTLVTFLSLAVLVFYEPRNKVQLALGFFGFALIVTIGNFISFALGGSI